MFQMSVVLKHDGLWLYVSGYPVVDTSDGTAIARHKEKVLSKIILSLGKSTYP